MTRAFACSRTAPPWGPRTRCAAPRSSPARPRASIRDLHFSQGIANATHPVRTAPRPDIGLESRVCVPIRCQGALFGYLWLIDADQSLTPSDCDAAERTAAEIGTAMYRRDELEKPQREHELRLLEALLGPDAAAARARGAELAAQELLLAGAGDRRARRALRGGTRTRSSAAAERARLGLALDQFRRALPRRQSLSVVHGDHGVMLVAALAGAARHARRDRRARAGRARQPRSRGDGRTR